MNASAPAAAGDASVARSKASKAAGAVAMISAVFISASSPATATECQAYKGSDRAYWSWREIDHRRCWYRGPRGLNKRALYWSATATVAAEPVRARSRAPRSGETSPAREVESNPPGEPDAASPSRTTPDVARALASRWPEADWTEAAQRLLEEVAAVTATASSPRVTHDDANNAGANHDRRHSPATPKNDTDQGRSPAVTIAVLAVSLGMIGAGAFLIRISA
jgi:hypothetical protein